MTSFPVEIEPSLQPRLAAGVLLLHLLAAALPWVSRCPAWLAGSLSVLALGGLAATLACLSGPHCLLQRLAYREESWHAMLAGDRSEVPAQLGPGTRVYAGLVVVDVRAQRGRMGWLLPRAALPPVEFRRLKVRLRLACYNEKSRS